MLSWHEGVKMALSKLNVLQSKPCPCNKGNSPKALSEDATPHVARVKDARPRSSS